jgi:hypothetical protein
MKYLLPLIVFLSLNSFGQVNTPIQIDTAKHNSNSQLTDTAKHVPNSTFNIQHSTLSSDSNVHIIESPEVKNTMAKMNDYERLSQGKYAGYRVQLDFGKDRDNANHVRSDFMTKYPAVPAYLTYQQPYFRISAGDFRTKLEAVHFLNLIKKDYPAAFVVHDKIFPPPL